MFSRCLLGQDAHPASTPYYRRHWLQAVPSRAAGAGSVAAAGQPPSAPPLSHRSANRHLAAMVPLPAPTARCCWAACTTSTNVAL